MPKATFSSGHQLALWDSLAIPAHTQRPVPLSLPRVTRGKWSNSLRVLVVSVEQQLYMNGELLHVQELNMSLISPQERAVLKPFRLSSSINGSWWRRCFRVHCGAEWWEWDPFVFGMNQSSQLEQRPKLTRLQEPYLPAGFSTGTKHSTAQQPSLSVHLYIPSPDRGNWECARSLLCTPAGGIPQPVLCPAPSHVRRRGGRWDSSLVK